MLLKKGRSKYNNSNYYTAIRGNAKFKLQIKRYPDMIGEKQLHTCIQRKQIVLEINILARK